jgi:hypothetical protein
MNAERIIGPIFYAETTHSDRYCVYLNVRETLCLNRDIIFSISWKKELILLFIWSNIEPYWESFVALSGGSCSFCCRREVTLAFTFTRERPVECRIMRKFVIRVGCE